MTLVFKSHEAGFANLLIHLADCWDRCRTLYVNVYTRHELSNCVVFNGYTITDSFDGEHPKTSILINNNTIQYIHPRMRLFVEPTDYMKRRIDECRHLVDGVCCAVHIRRGAYSHDSTQFKENIDKWSYHCSDAALEKFKSIVRVAPGPVFLATDSPSIRTMFQGKVRMLEDVEFAHTHCQESTASRKGFEDVYLEWFLLSMCPKIYVTGGNTDLVGFSTFSYTAAVYGNKPFECVFN